MERTVVTFDIPNSDAAECCDFEYSQQCSIKYFFHGFQFFFISLSQTSSRIRIPSLNHHWGLYSSSQSPHYSIPTDRLVNQNAIIHPPNRPHHAHPHSRRSNPTRWLRLNLNLSSRYSILSPFPPSRRFLCRSRRRLNHQLYI